MTCAGCKHYDSRGEGGDCMHPDSTAPLFEEPVRCDKYELVQIERTVPVVQVGWLSEQTLQKLQRPTRRDWNAEKD